MTEVDVTRWFEARRDALLAGTLGPAAAFPSAGDIAVARGMIEGDKDVRRRQLEFMAEVKRKFGAPVSPASMPDKDLEEYLSMIKEQPTVGATTIATVSLKKSGWSPDVGKSANVPQKFVDYLAILSKAPCMEVSSEFNQTVSYRETNYDELIKKAAKVIKASQGSDTSEIEGALTDLASAATTNIEKEQSVCIMAQNVVSVDPRTPGYSVYLTQSTMKMKEAKAHVLETSLTIFALKLTFSVDMWKSGLYRVIGRKAYEDANDWLEAVNTPSGPGRRALCIGG